MAIRLKPAERLASLAGLEVNESYKTGALERCVADRPSLRPQLVHEIGFQPMIHEREQLLKS